MNSEELQRELDVCSDAQALYEQYKSIFFWVGTSLMAAAVGSLAIAGSVISAPIAIGLGILGTGSMFGSMYFKQQENAFQERNEQAYSVRHSRDNADAILVAMEISKAMSVHKGPCKNISHAVTDFYSKRGEWAQKESHKRSQAEGECQSTVPLIH